MAEDGSLRTPRPDCVSPVGFAVMKQEWRELAYIHFDYDPDVVQALLPPGLEVDTWGGRAWVGLIPFSMRRISFPFTPPVPWLGSFPEINVRTYVIRDGVPGVWFFSLDVNRLLPAFVARLTYRLPYCWGSASNVLVGDSLVTDVRRRWPAGHATARIEVSVGETITDPTPFEHFLTARWGLYSRAGGKKLRYAPVDHPRWELHRASVMRLEENLFAAAGLPSPSGEPHCMYSSGVPVRIGLPRRARDARR
ncbi:MAG: hypothetical protein RL430_171 [Actinomycetota bacterium]